MSGRNANHNDEQEGYPCETINPYRVILPVRYTLLSVASSILFAFAVGRFARIFLIEQPYRELLDALSKTENSIENNPHNLPIPILQEGKEFPASNYSGRNFDSTKSATVNSLFIQKRVPQEGESASNDSTEDSEYLPAGQHLLVDIKHVDGKFLNDEQRLAEAMVDLIHGSNNTLVSYHCHTIIPLGVSCAGVLLESHVSFHTWPDEGVITFDLFTCGSRPLIPLMPDILRLFGVPSEDEDGNKPEYIWAHKLRGFRNDKRHCLSTDLGKELIGVMDFDMKQEVASTQSKTRVMHIYDVINPRYSSLAGYRKSLTKDGSYESQHAEIFQPDRVFYINGIIQRSMRTDEIYHESHVHPGMFSHRNPRQVAIIGLGHGATLREILKHKTVERVKMIVMDEIVFRFSNEHIPEWNDCRDLIGSASSCLDDDRVEIIFGDAVEWFLSSTKRNDAEVEKFDVIFVEAVHASIDPKLADTIYHKDHYDFLISMYNSLTDDGILITKQRKSPTYTDAPNVVPTSDGTYRKSIIEKFEEIGAESVHIFEAPHMGFSHPTAHLIFCKSSICRLNWNFNSAEIEISIRKRLLDTHSGTSPLKYFDGATMQQFKQPHKIFETVYCRNQPTPTYCTAFFKHTRTLNLPLDEAFEIRTSGAGEKSGRGAYAKVDIPKGTLLGLGESVLGLDCSPSSYNTIKGLLENVEEAEELDIVETFFTDYGFEIDAMPGDNLEFHVHSSVMKFVNHGCDSTDTNLAGFDSFSCFEDPECKMLVENESEIYNPLYYRHRLYFSEGFDFALRDIKAGEEILFDYTELAGSVNEKEISNHKDYLQKMCRGELIGGITEYENESGDSSDDESSDD